MKEEDKISWQAYEYYPHKRSKEWYFAFYVISGALVITSIILNNYLFALVLFIAAFTLTLYTKRTPEIIEYEISKNGVKEKNTLYPYSELNSFWIDNSIPQMPKLLIHSKKAIMPLMVLPLSEIGHEHIAGYLSEFLEETELHEPLSHKIMEYLGF